MNEQHTEKVEPPLAETDPFSSSGTSPWCPSSFTAYNLEASHAA